VKPEPQDGHGSTRPHKRREKTPSDDFAQFCNKDPVADVALLEERVKNSVPNLGVLKEYRNREEVFLNRVKDLEDDGLRKQRLDDFVAGFNLISSKLKDMYQVITLGENAELEPVDSITCSQKAPSSW